MGIVVHWFLPTNGDSRTDLSLGNAVGVEGSRVTQDGAERVPDIGYAARRSRPSSSSSGRRAVRAKKLISSSLVRAGCSTWGRCPH